MFLVSTLHIYVSGEYITYISLCHYIVHYIFTYICLCHNIVHNIFQVTHGYLKYMDMNQAKNHFFHVQDRGNFKIRKYYCAVLIELECWNFRCRLGPPFEWGFFRIFWNRGNPYPPCSLKPPKVKFSFMILFCWNLKRNIFICLPIIINIKNDE